MTKTYTISLCGLKRELPILPISPTLSIASFVILGDTELVGKTAPALLKKLPPFDILITAEAKGIPLACEMARLLNQNYVIARKSIKGYMDDPLTIKVNSITTQKEQMLCLDGKDARTIKGKRIALIDDVISTGESIAALEQLVTAAGGIIAVKAAILAEGDAAKRTDIIYLQELPLFPQA